MTVQTPLYLQPRIYPARLDRQLLSDFFNPGVLKGSDLAVTPTGNAREVSVARGVAYVAGTVNPDQGTYRVFNDGAITLVHDPIVTFPRVDLIVVRVYDDTELSNNPAGPHTGSIEVIEGVETNGATAANLAGAPSDVSLPPNIIKVAYVVIGDNGVLPVGNVVDRRPLAGLKPGGTPPIGAIMPYAGDGEPNDGYYTMADGKLIDALIYSTFLTKVGHAYNGGVDPGNGKVRVPDKRGRSSVGASNMGTAMGNATGNGRIQIARGVNFGEVLHALTSAENGPHAHGVTDPGHGHRIRDISGPAGAQGGGINLNSATQFEGSNWHAQTNTTGISIVSSGSGTGHNTVHPVEADNCIVRIA